MSNSDNQSTAINKKIKDEILFPIQPRKVCINSVKNRLMQLSPTVELGLERECTKNDFTTVSTKPIGTGAFGEVWKVLFIPTQKEYCIKILDKREIVTQRMTEQLNLEIGIMYKVNHPNSLQLINHFEDDEKIYMVMNYISNGNLFNLMKSKGKFDEETAAKYFIETLLIIEHLHSFTPKIVHRDIKPENLLLDNDYNLLLTDYGWACYYDESQGKKMTTYCGTPEYVSPEMLRKIGYDETIDIWAIGVLLFEMLAGYAPFTANNKDDVFRNIRNLKINWPQAFPELAKDLVSKILKYEPKERLKINDIWNHPWLIGYVKKMKSKNKNNITRKISKKDILLSHLLNPNSNNTNDGGNNNSNNNTKYNKSYSDKYIKSLSESEIQYLKLQNIELDNKCIELENKCEQIKTLEDTIQTINAEKNKLEIQLQQIPLLKQERDELILENESLRKKILQLENDLSLQRINQIHKEYTHILTKNEIKSPCDVFEDIPLFLKEINEKLKLLNKYSNNDMKQCIEEVGSFCLKEIQNIVNTFSIKTSSTFKTINFLQEQLIQYQQYKSQSEIYQQKVKDMEDIIKMNKDKEQALKDYAIELEKGNKFKDASLSELKFLTDKLKAKMKDIKQYSEVIDNVSIRNNIQQIVGDI